MSDTSRAKKLISLLEKVLTQDYLYTDEEIKRLKAQLRSVKEELKISRDKSSKGFKWMYHL